MNIKTRFSFIEKTKFITRPPVAKATSERSIYLLKKSIWVSINMALVIQGKVYKQKEKIQENMFRRELESYNTEIVKF